MSKKMKVGLGFLAFLCIASFILNGFFLLVYMVDSQIGSSGRKERAIRVVEQLDAASQMGVLAQFYVDDVEIVGKPRMMTGHVIDGQRHEMMIVPKGKISGGLQIQSCFRSRSRGNSESCVHL